MKIPENNTSIQSVEDNKKTIGNLFDRIAVKYDLLNHLLTLNIDKYWRKKTVDNCPKNAEKVLDVATGTCDLAIEIIKANKSSSLIGIDLSNQMLEIGKAKIEQRDLEEKITLINANAEQMPFDDEEFDFVSCAFGVRNFSNLEKCLKQMFRVLKKGGKVIILEFSYPSNPIVKLFYNIYFTYLLPLIGKTVSKDKTAYKYLMQSVKNFPKGKEFTDIMQKAGFENTVCKNLTFKIASIYTAYKK